MRQEIVKVQHIQRFDDADAVAPSEVLICLLAHDRIHMDRIDRLNIRMLLHDTADGSKHVMHGLAQVLPAVSGDNDQSAVRRPLQVGMGIIRAYRCRQCIDRGVACNEDILRLLALSQKVFPGGFGGREDFVYLERRR